MPLFLFLQREKAAEKEKLNWDNRKSAERLYPSCASLFSVPFFSSPEEKKGTKIKV